MNSIARLIIEIVASQAKFQTDLQNASKSTQAEARKIQKSIDDLKTKAADFGKTIAAAIGVPLTAGALIETLSSIKDKTIEGERSIAQLQAVLQSTGHAAGLTSGQLEDLGRQVKGSTVFDDESIRAAATALLRFRTIQGDTFREALQLAPDVAAALGTDLPDAARAIGRALTDPEGGMRALRAAGLSLSEQQKDLAARLIETGDRAGAQRIVMDALAGSVRGAGEADNKGLYGATKRLTRAIGELEQAAGKKFFSNTAEDAQKVTGFFERLKQRIDDTNISFTQLITRPGALLHAATSIGADLLQGLPERGKRQVSGKIGGLGPSQDELNAEAGARDARIKEREEQAYSDQKAALKRRADGAASYFAGELQEQRSFLEETQSKYDFAYRHGNVSTADYFNKERALADQQYIALRDNLGKQATAVEAFANGPGATREEREAAFAHIRQIADQSDAARLERNKRSLALDQQQAEAIERLKDEYAGLAQKLAELRGDSVGAATIGFDLANKEIRKRIDVEAASGDALAQSRAQAAQRDLDALRQRTILQAQLTKGEEQYGQIVEAVSIGQARIQLQQQSGAITELDALRQTSDLNRAALPILQQRLALLQASAEATKDPAAILAVEQLKLKMEELAATGDLVAKKFNDVFQTSFSDAIAEFSSGTKSLRDTVKDLEKSIVGSINRIASQNISETLFGKGGPLSGIGNVLSGLFGGKSKDGAAGGIAERGSVNDFIKDAFGPSSGLSVAGTTLTTAGTLLTTAAASLQAAAATLGVGSATGGFAGIGGGFSDGSLFGGAGDFAGFPGFAGGGSPPVGRPSIVGENGPEIFIPRSSGTIVPNDVLNSRREARAGGMSVTNHFHISGSVNTRTVDQIGVKTLAALQKASRKAG